MYLAQGYNMATRVRIKPRPLAPESDALTTRPPRLPIAEVNIKVISKNSIVNNCFIILCELLVTDKAKSFHVRLYYLKNE